jgi:uncharacterized iron-regulated membrane protein
MAEKKLSTLFKKVIGKLHLWLGLASGIIVFIIAVTGCLYAFQAEIRNLTEGHRFVEIQNKPYLPPSRLKDIAMAALPGKHLHAVLYGKPGKAAEVIFYHPDPVDYYVAYLNPYTGEILKLSDEEAGFFPFILDGHFYLWLPNEIGQPIVASATLVFFFMLISGIVLWWPRNKAAAKQRVSIKWSARWRRKNYDLHNVLGFYVSWIAIIFAITGLVWGFTWFAEGLYAVTGGEKSVMYAEPMSDTTQVASFDEPVMDKIWRRMTAEYPNAAVLEVHSPETASSPIAVGVNPDDGTYWQNDNIYFDQYTLKELPVDHVYGRFKDAAAADKLMRMNYDIHVGAVLGLPGKILAFCASLLCASLPVTGFYIWWGRRKKKGSELEDEADTQRARKPAAIKRPAPVMRRPVVAASNK